VLFILNLIDFVLSIIATHLKKSYIDQGWKKWKARCVIKSNSK